MLVQIWTLLEVMMACLRDTRWNPRLSHAFFLAADYVYQVAVRRKIWVTLNVDKIEPQIDFGARADDVLFAWLEIEPLVVSGCCVSLADPHLLIGANLCDFVCWLLMASGTMLIVSLREVQNETSSCPRLTKSDQPLGTLMTGPIHEKIPLSFVHFIWLCMLVWTPIGPLFDA